MERTVIYCSRSLWSRWPGLARHWHRRYPRLFDADDLRLTESQPKNHFKEWLAAIHVFRRDGAYSLIEKYNVKRAHPRKRPIFERLVSARQRSVLDAICSHVQPPDLFVFRPGSTVFWFAEVKGEGEPTSDKQIASHRLIERRLGVPVELIEVRLGRRPLPNRRVKLAAGRLQGRIAVVRQHSSLEGLINGAPGRAGRRSLSAIR